MLKTHWEPASGQLTLVPEEDLLSSNSDRAARALENALKENAAYTRLVLDLSGCRMVDSVGLNLVFGFLHRAKELKKNPLLKIAKGPLERVMRVARMDKIFTLEVVKKD